MEVTILRYDSCPHLNRALPSSQEEAEQWLTALERLILDLKLSSLPWLYQNFRQRLFKAAGYFLEDKNDIPLELRLGCVQAFHQSRRLFVGASQFSQQRLEDYLYTTPLIPSPFLTSPASASRAAVFPYLVLVDARLTTIKRFCLSAGVNIEESELFTDDNVESPEPEATRYWIRCNDGRDRVNMTAAEAESGFLTDEQGLTLIEGLCLLYSSLGKLFEEDVKSLYFTASRARWPVSFLEPPLLANLEQRSRLGYLNESWLRWYYGANPSPQTGFPSKWVIPPSFIHP